MDRYRRCRDFAKALESTGGTRSHIRATSELRAASIFPEANENGNGKAAASVAAAQAEDPAPTVATPAPATETVASTATSHRRSDDATTASPVASEEVDEARKRRVKQSAAIGGVIVVVLIAWFAGVKALRSASEPADTQGNVDTTSAEPTSPAPAMIAPTPVVIAPLPAPPVATTAATAKTTVPTTTKHQATTTPAQSTVQQTSASNPPKPATATTPLGPNVLDTRPAVGMPCGAEGSAAVSNSGGPVTCVGTPGGFAWEPPGG
jgi:serine/threonine-protein kinase